MEKKIKINIKYTVKDIKAYSFARTISKPLNKILLIISSLIAVFYLVLISLVFFISQGDESIILFTLFLSFFIIFFMNLLVAIIPFVIFYISTLNNYRKSKLMEKLQCLEINYEEMSMHSLSGNFSIKWNDIYRVQELKPCFLIFISPYKSILLPRRCFNNEAQLAEFKSILAEKMQKNKLKLKNYKIGKVSPDDDEKIEAIEPLKEFPQQTAKEEETELLNLCFSLSKKDIIQMNYIYYYSSPIGIAITIIGISFLLTAVIRYFAKANDSIITLPLGFLGLMFTLFIPIMLYSNSSKSYEKDANIKKPCNYSFYDDYFIVSNPSGINRIRWDELVKVKEIKTAYMLFAGTQIAYVIPRHVIAYNEEKSKIFQKMIKDKLMH